MKKYIFISAVIVSLISSCFTFSITGKITSEESGEPLISANIVIENVRKGASSNLDGIYVINNVEPGEYTLSVSMLGYRKRRMDIQLDKDLVLDFEMVQDVERLQPVIVSANRIKQNLQDSPVTISVVDSSQLSDIATISMDQALRSAPGVTMHRSSISLRNCSGFAYGVGSRVLIMLDGVPMLSGESGEVKWDALPINHVKQIEIVKNAGSALYGSNAIGGVVNIITDDPKGTSYSADFDLGIYDRPHYPEWRWSKSTRIFHSVSGEFSSQMNKWSLTARISEKQSDSYRELDDFSRFDSFIKAKYKKNDNEDIALTTNIAYEDRGRYLNWLNIEHALEVDSLQKDDRVYSSKIFFSGVYNRRDPAKRRSSSLKGYTFLTGWHDRTYNSEDSTTDRSFANSSKSGIEYSTNLGHIDKHFITTGFEAYLATVNSTYFDSRVGGGGALFTQDEISLFHPFVLSIGGRFDYFSVEDAEQYYQFSPKLGAVYHILENIAVRSSIGTGYRTPSMAELFSDLSVAGLLKIVPNPDLKAEKSLSTEFGGNIITPFGIFDAAIFASWYDDFIEPRSVEDSDTEYEFQNIERARVYGTELSFSIYHKYIDFSANYQYTQSEDLKINEKLPYRPEHIYSLQAKLKYYKNFSLNAVYRYKSEKDFILQPTQGYSPSAEEKVLDIGHNMNFGKFYVNVKVNNVLQYHYSEVQYGIEPIRHYVVSTGFRF